MTYNSDNVEILVGGIAVKGFTTDEPFVSARMWHKAKRLDSGNWIVSITHKHNRIIDIEFTDENYNKYGFENIRPSMVNPYTIDYNDEDLREVK